MPGRLPVTLLTGFLGAGKTTLLNAFLKRPEGAGTLVLVNEFGEADIDGAVLAAEISGESRLYSLPNGCLCCDLQAGLAETLQQMLETPRLAERPLERVIIETTGLANPAAILRPFAYNRRIEALALRPRIVTLAAATNILDQLGRFREAVAQVAVADELVLTKCDLVEAAEAQDVKAELRRVNPAAPVHISGGKTDSAADLPALLAKSAAGSFGEVLPDEDGRALHSAGIATFAVHLGQPLDPDRFRDMLSFLILRHADRLLRMKGIVRFQNEAAPRLINVVHDIHASSPSPGARLRDAGSLVFIGIDLPEAEIRADLTRCQA